MRFTHQDVASRGHPIWAEIDLGAIRHNIGLLRERAAGAEVMGVVKGYAYGHGNPESAVAMLEGGATRLGVARVAEGIHLRNAGIEAPIHVFTEPPHEAVATMIAGDLTPTVYTEAFARALSDAAVSAGKTVPVHIKLDTGMHRVGLPADDVPDAIRAIGSLPGLEIEGAWSHLAVADEPDHPFTDKQVALFNDLLGQIESAGVSLRYRHLANSAATIARPDTHFDVVRCGIASYGLWPSDAFIGMLDLRPAMALRGRVGMVKTVAEGEAVSYGLHYQLERTGRVVTITAGYADGYDRRLSGIGDVLLRGSRFRVSGTICMDQFMVDVGDEAIEIGEVATLIGSDGDQRVTAEELAVLIGTINYEVTTRVPSRVPRIYLGLDDGA